MPGDPIARRTGGPRVAPLAAMLALAFGPVDALAATDAQRIAALEQRIAELEARLDAATVPASTASTASTPSGARVDDLEQGLRVVQRKLELKDEEAAAALPKTAVVTAGEKGFGLASRDGAFNLKLRGLVQVDARDYFDDSSVPAVDGTLIRRARPIVEGTVGGIYDFRLMPDFAGNRTVLQDAYIEARLHPAAKLRVGKFKTPFGLERLQTINDARFAELGLPTNLVPNRDLGIQLSGDVLGGTLNYAIGVFNGVLDGGSSEASNDVDNNADKDIAARLFAQPFLNGDNFRLRGLGLGIAATYVDQRGTGAASLLPGYRTPGQLSAFAYRTGATGTFADGRRLRWSPQLTYYTGAWGVLAEQVTVDQAVSRRVAGSRRHDVLHNRGWQVALNYVLTGEDASYKGIKPKAPFAPGSGSWGAWEAVARIGELDVDNDAFTGGAASFADPNAAISNAQAWTLGVNWYLNSNLKWSVTYEQTDFQGGAAGGRDRADEKIAFSRFQLAF
ncbi:MAG: porin [Xanthomonadaceae bacterium]|nr:porin [Xanthomonadaceae bacterium]